MLTFIFGILMLAIFGKLAVFALKMAWSVSKIVVTIIILPLVLIGMVVGGLMTIALPLLIVIGIITLVKTVF